MKHALSWLAFLPLLAGSVAFTGACAVTGTATPEAAATPGAPAVAPTARSEGRSEGLGHITFPNSGPPAAQEPFLKGMLLLHSFEYADAAEAFRAAQSVAPDFALAYWGEALTFCHPIWQEEDRSAAQAVLARLGSGAEARAAKTVDERERGLLGAVEILFGEGTRGERAVAYCAALGALAERYPADLEIRSLYALSILGTATQGRDVPTYMRAAAVAERVLEEAPDHPGALHYAIHSFDDPVHATLGLRMARRYGKVAAAAEHALHMPSHIYVALGMWPDAIAANVDAVAAADARRARKGLGVDARGLHSLAWLAYARLQVGEVAAAERLLADMRRDEHESGSKRARGALVDMRAAHVVATQDFAGEAAAFEVGIEGLEPAHACAELYVRGRAALARDDLAGARRTLEAFGPLRGALEELDASAGGAAQCCSTNEKRNYLPGRQAAHVMELELSGLIALASGAEEDGLARLAAAAEKEDAMGYDFGPPAVVEPAHELLGHALLARGRPGEARIELEAALRRAPGRARSQQGLEEASVALARESAARVAAPGTP